jgi:hypothetical protein
MMCAALLSVAVSGMHWTAAVGTSYRLIPGVSGLVQLSRSQTVIICAALVRYIGTAPKRTGAKR